MFKGTQNLTGTALATRAVQELAVDMNRLLAAEPGNLAFSPYSIAVALAMTRRGACGRTAEQMDAVLHSPDSERLSEHLNALSHLLESRAGEWRDPYGDKAHSVELDAANSLWGQVNSAWKRDFVDEIARQYGAGMRLVDFVSDAEDARSRINGWTADQTHERIPEILPPDVVGPATRLVLVNALYLKAPWREPFTRERTRPRPFTLSDGTTLEVDTMVRDLNRAELGEGPGWQAVRLSYAGDALATTVVVPEADLAQLEDQLDADMLRLMLTEPSQRGSVRLELPRWRLRSTIPLNELLQTLGMTDAFSGLADFSAMCDEPLHISAALHEAFIAVDEAGTEAAAATAVVMSRAAFRRSPVLKVDRPFLFVIHDVETAVPLFVGRVSDPSVLSPLGAVLEP
jgi:serpin B